jgi:hypothetical protein
MRPVGILPLQIKQELFRGGEMKELVKYLAKAIVNHREKG